MAERGHTFATKEQQEEAERFTIDSAFMIAHERALETERGDQALVKDPFARQLAGEKGAQLSDSFGMYFKPLGFKEWPEFHKTWTVVRSKYIDDLIDNLATEGCGLHMVNLGAGVDTRVLRLESYRHFSASYEVELEAQNEAKVATFATLEATPKCPQVLVSVNLLDASALASALAAKGFDQTKPSVFLAEGLIQYLKGDEAGFISSVSSVAASGSTLILQYWDNAGKDGSTMGISRSSLENWLTEGGWSDFRNNMFGDEVLNYGRFKADEEPNPGFSFMVCKKA
eukprot:TRINITY_DN25968_c0_g1_i1.p1 TRINITY_DN25968_c0_g1~~TRINITY_DN25968_c0_g1_i1.p1  ORF type:complete len:285 (+),score=64.27 TRINITY_DN25968_c0_g1_i1:49-903(+)